MKTYIELFIAIGALAVGYVLGFSEELFGIHMLIMLLGICGIFLLKQEQSREKCQILDVTTGLFALFTLLGQSYLYTQSWDVLFKDAFHIIAALICWTGYSLSYKKSILLVRRLSVKASKKLKRRTADGMIERKIFEEHSFIGPWLIILLLEIPWFISFFPGTLEADAKHQLLMAYGISELTGHHPILVTKIMGKCIYIGRLLFASDTIGVFLYTFPQVVMQSLVFAYTIYVMKYMKAPVILRWFTLVFYCIYPIFPIWGYTMVKDSGYYILILLFVVTLVCLLKEKELSAPIGTKILLLMSAVGISCLRKEGSLVVAVTLFCGLLAYKKCRLLFTLGIVMCLCSTLLVNRVYMRFENIPSGSFGEALSVPLQQTARYITNHYEEISAEEMEVLQNVFTVDIDQIPGLYNPELSDPVKVLFKAGTGNDDLKQYIGVWWKQLIRHPGTYVQAFLHHTYGYWYPDKKDSWEGEDIGVFQIAKSDEFDVDFGVRSDTGRNILEGYARLMKELPILGMFYRTGFHTWTLLGCVLYLRAKKNWKSKVVYLPGVCILVFCMLSPVNACTRYMLPIMALLPIHLAWLDYSNQNEAVAGCQ